MTARPSASRRLAPVGAALLALATAACVEPQSTTYVPPTTTTTTAYPATTYPAPATVYVAPSGASAATPTPTYGPPSYPAPPPPAPEVIVRPANPQFAYVNPPQVYRTGPSTQAVVVTGPTRLIFVNGQQPIDADGRLVGMRDLGWQTDQALANVDATLRAAGADLRDVTKWTIYVVQGQDLRPAYDAFLRRWGGRGTPPPLSMVQVAGLPRTDHLVEIDAIAALPR